MIWVNQVVQGILLGGYYAVLAAAKDGLKASPRHSVAVQLQGQSAKAWARLGDRRQVELALERGRELLDALPYPDNPRNHFQVDPAKFDFYAMDCYRLLGANSGGGGTENRLAETYAHEIIRTGTDHDGTERAPMRIAEARVHGDVWLYIDQLAYGHEFVESNIVRLHCVPGVVEHGRALVRVTDGVIPAPIGKEIPSWQAPETGVELTQQCGRVWPKPVYIVRGHQ